MLASISEIPAGSMKYVEVLGYEILLINVKGKIHATDNRCGHMNGPLSMGTLKAMLLNVHSIMPVSTVPREKPSDKAILVEYRML